MFRLALILLFLPTLAAADWSPRPTMFNYDATFARCIQDPSLPDLAASCSDAIATDYSLKRAVARAVYLCADSQLLTCTIPFEDEGLPAIAVRIAIDSGCENSDVSSTGNWDKFDDNHCVTVASDIMIDEGVVPLDTDISCRNDLDDCGFIAFLNVGFWIDLILPIADDDPVVLDLHRRNITECMVDKFTPISELYSRWAVDCVSERHAALWVDITLNSEQDN